MTTPQNNCDGYIQDCLSILWFCCVVFYYLALLSHSSDDPSYYVAVSPQLDSRANLGGIIGAELSAHALTWLGRSAYFLPLVMLFARAKSQPQSYQSRAVKALAFTKSLSRLIVIMSLMNLWIQLLFADPGWIGNHLRQFAHTHFGPIGIWIAAFTFTAVYLTYEFQLTIQTQIYRLVHSMAALIYHGGKLSGKLVGRLVGRIGQISWHNLIFMGRLITHLFNKILLTTTQDTPLNPISRYFGRIRSQLRLANYFHLHQRTTAALTAPPLTTSGVQPPSPPLARATSSNFSHQSSALNPDHHDPAAATTATPPTPSHRQSQSIPIISLPKPTATPSTSAALSPSPSPRAGRRKLKLTSAQGDHLAEVLKQTLLDFHIKGQLHGYESGPRLITFEFEPNSGIKQTKLTSLADDIARALKVESVLIQPMAGKSSLGIQVPRPDPYIINLLDETPQLPRFSGALPVALGVTPSGDWIKVDLATMPHLLMAGATGSGKSVGIHALINSLIRSRSPDEVRLILVDPKMLELSAYNQLPHLAAPVITEPTLACQTLHWAVNEMERRYRMMQDMEVRHVKDFNTAWQHLSSPQKQEWLAIYPNTDILPYLVIIIDELADLMLISPKDVEGLIQRLSQKARASGIHLVLATQRPSVDVITGVIKANFPARIAYQVVSKHDSRTILDQIGAEKLLGKGDMLYQDPKRLRPIRLQGAYVSEKQIKSLMKSLQARYTQTYLPSLTQELEAPELSADTSAYNRDPKWEEALSIAKQKGSISASFLQRKLQIGYNRAARIIEMMEQANYVAPSQGSKPRPWLGHSSPP